MNWYWMNSNSCSHSSVSRSSPASAGRKRARLIVSRKRGSSSSSAPRRMRERPHAVLEQAPGEALGLVGLVVDHLLLPDEVGLRHRQHQLVEHRPDRLERDPQVLARALVDRVVGEVHVKARSAFTRPLISSATWEAGRISVGAGPLGHTGAPSSCGHVRHVLVAAAAEADQHRRVGAASARPCAAPRRTRARSRAPG